MSDGHESWGEVKRGYDPECGMSVGSYVEAKVTIQALKDEIASLRKLVRWRNDNTRATVLSIPDDVVGAFLRALEEKP